MQVDYYLAVGCLLMAACRPDTIDISRLSAVDQVVFAEAAAVEGVDTTQNGWQPLEWEVEYDFTMRKAGGSAHNKLNIACRIRLNPNEMRPCPLGGIRQMLLVVSRHELRHCQGYFGHSADPNSLMAETPPCWPAD